MQIRTATRSAIGGLLAVGLVACGSAKDREARYLAHGQKYFAAENYDKARVEFSNALQIQPKDAQAHYLLAQVEEKLQDLRVAAGQYQAAIDIDPTLAPARAGLARIFVLAGIPEKALELVAPGLKTDPTNAQLLTARGAAKTKLGDLKGGQADAEAAFGSTPDDAYVVALLTSLYHAEGDDAKAVATVKSAIARNPDSFDFHLMLADLDQRMNHPAEAEAELKRLVELDPKKIERRYLLAHFYEINHRGDDAEQALREAVRIDPDNAKPKLLLVSVIGEFKGVDQANRELESMIQVDPKNDEFRMALADNLRGEGKVEDAERSYHAVIEHARKKPFGLKARDHMAEEQIARGQTSSAQDLIGEVLAENPRDRDALMMRAGLALERGDAASAITDLRTVQRDEPSAPDVLRALALAHRRNGETALAEEAMASAAQAAPQDVGVQLDYAGMLEQDGKIADARAVLERVSMQHPDDTKAVEGLMQVQLRTNDLAAATATAHGFRAKHPELAVSYYLEGIAAEAGHDLSGASAQYERALSMLPEATQPLTAIVRLDMSRKQPDAALRHIDAVLAKVPADVYALNLKGDVFMSSRQFADAAKVYADALVREPTAASLYPLLAKAYEAQGQNDQAVQVLRDGISRNPRALALVSALAEFYVRLGRPQDAVATYEEGLKQHPGSALLANNLAMVLVNSRTDASSLARARELVASIKDSADPSFIDTRGWVSFKSGEYRDAEPMLRQAAERAPGDPVLLYHLGMAQFRSGDTTEARRNLEAAVKAGRPFLGLEEAKATLQQLHVTAAE